MKREYTPLYLRIKSDIISKIASGELKKGDRLPPERELAETLGVSRITIVGALKELAHDGIIMKIHGSGSYISCEKLEEEYDDIFSHITGHAEIEISFGLRNADPQYELMMKTLAGLFQLENPDIKVRIKNIHIPYYEQDDTYLLKIGSGEAPSIGEFFMYSDYAAINGLVPLEELPGFQNLAATLHPHSIYETADAEGKKHVHALPSRVNARVVLVNSDMLTRAGIKNIDGSLDRQRLLEWTKVLEQYTKRRALGEYATLTETPYGWHGVVGKLPYLWSSKAEFPNSIDGFSELLQSSSCKRGVSFLTELYQACKPAPLDGLDLFASGRLGIIPACGTWPLALNKLMVSKFQMMAFPIPGEDKNLSVPSIMGNYCLGIFRSAIKHDAEINAAWKWIKYLLRKKQQYWLTSSDLSFPALGNIPCALEKEYPELYPVFARALEGSIPQFDCRNIRKAMALFGTELQQCFAGKISPSECIGNAVRNIQSVKYL